MKTFKEQFIASTGSKKTPNNHENYLLERAHKYIDKIKNIRGIQMIAICNSLSMFATKLDSDIDLFIVTKKGMIWYVRFFVTLYFWRYGVWRKGKDIAGNFCLSFFATEDALNLQSIAIKDDIYLYYWIYYLKPIIDYDNTYQKFLGENTWVEIEENQIQENKKFLLKKEKSKNVCIWHFLINDFLRFFLRRKTLKNFEKLGRPQGVIISDNMLKFHDKDQRENLKNAVIQKIPYKKDFENI